jgi:DNA-binding winged helix-turn-helix (wHTH) protein/tetratricopeptide (TPR) repeat protein
MGHFPRGSMKSFPPYRLDVVNQCLWCSSGEDPEQRILLSPKAFAILRYLVDRAGRLVPQDEFLRALWPGIHVQPEVLKSHIRDIRSALADDPKNPRFIENLPRRGYRFIAPVADTLQRPEREVDLSTQRLVGRDKELRRLQESFQRSLRGERQIVFVTGEAGIGKTALVDEFLRQLAAEGLHSPIGRGQCVEGFGGKEAYYPMLEAIGQLCRAESGSLIPQILAAQAPTWLVQFPAFVRRDQREMLQREIQGATRDRMLREISEALESIAAEEPLLIILEDLHWADHSTVDLISALARRRRFAKLMLVGTFRPVEVTLAEHPLRTLKQDLLIHDLCKEIALEPFTITEIGDYLALGSETLAPPQDLVDLIYRHTEGNPLFVVASVEKLTQRGFVSQESGAWKLLKPLQDIDLEVPESLRQMIEMQIDLLSPDVQRVLEAASLESIGRFRFAVAGRAAAGGIEQDVFEEVCETLSRRHFILRVADPVKLRGGMISACYEFVHALYREVCYRRIAPGVKAKLHQRLGEWAEEHLDQVNEEATWLAGHFEEGCDWSRAIKYLLVAADNAGRRFEPLQAARNLEHALDLVAKLPETDRAMRKIDILDKLARTYMALYDPRALQTCEDLAAQAALCGLLDLEVRALLAGAYCASWVSSQRCSEMLDQTLRHCTGQIDPLLRARTRASCHAMRLWAAGWNPQDMREFESAFAEILATNDRRILGPHVVEDGLINWFSSKYRKARRSFIEGRAMMPETIEHNSYSAYQVSPFAIPLNLLFLGEWGEALREMQDAIAAFDKNSEYYAGQAVRLYRAWLHLDALDYAGGIAICRSALPLICDPKPRPAPGNPIPFPQEFRLCLTLMGSGETALGNHERALEYLQVAQADKDRPPATYDWYFRMPLESALTELWLAKGDLAQARTQAQAFLKSSLATVERTWQALAWEVNARIAIAELDLAKAKECISNGLSAIEGFEAPLAAWRVHATANELYGRMKSRKLAESHRTFSARTILQLADSLGSNEHLRKTFLSAPGIRQILGDSTVGVEPTEHP